MKFTHLFALALLLSFSATTSAEDASLKESLGSKFPNLKIEQVKETPIKGLFEVLAGGNVVYMSKDARYLISGEMRDLETNKNLTEVTLGTVRLNELAKFSQDEMITFEAKGEEKGELYVFTDVTCPYCSKLHQEVPALNEAGVSVKYLLYPRGKKGSKIYQLSHDIWCAEDRKAALDKAKKDKDYPSKTGDCDTPIAKVHKIGEQFGLSGTPYMVTGTGEAMPGYVPAKGILQRMGL